MNRKDPNIFLVLNQVRKEGALRSGEARLVSNVRRTEGSMVNLRKFLKFYSDAGAFHALFAPHRFVDDSVFLTKSNQLGIVLGCRRYRP